MPFIWTETKQILVNENLPYIFIWESLCNFLHSFSAYTKTCTLGRWNWALKKGQKMFQFLYLNTSLCKKQTIVQPEHFLKQCFHSVFPTEVIYTILRGVPWWMVCRLKTADGNVYNPAPHSRRISCHKIQ